MTDCVYCGYPIAQHSYLTPTSCVIASPNESDNGQSEPTPTPTVERRDDE